MKSFSTTTELLPYQIDAVNKLLRPRVGALFADMGTGKTRMVIDLINRRQSKIDKVVYFAPVSLKPTVREQLREHTDLEPSQVHTFDDKTSEQNLPNSMWHIVGIESMSSSARVVTAVNKLITPNTYVVVDESGYIKGHNALRTQRISYLSEKTKYRNILSGRPISQGMEDLFAQMRFLSPKILGYNSFYSFAANHLEYSDKYPGRIVRAHNTEYIAAKIQPYVYQITKEECLDLPRKLHSTRYFDMSEEQSQWYQWVKDDAMELISRYDNWEWSTSKIIFKLFTDLQRVISGCVKYKGKLIELDNPRLEHMVDVIYNLPAESKVIIFGKFQYDADQIREALGKEFGDESVVAFDGRTTGKKRERAVKQFRKEAKFLVTTQAVASHGFNFQDVAHHTIFYNNGFKYAEREQAEDRTHRIGQLHRPTYIDLHCCCGIEDRIAASLRRKGNVVDDFRAEVNKVKKDKVKELIMGL